MKARKLTKIASNKKCVDDEERGHAHLPNFETLEVERRSDAESLSGTNDILKPNQLQVGKAGLPALSLR